MSGFDIRAPWWVREREHTDLRDARSRRPVLQMYDRTDFVDRLVADPGDCLAFGTDDRWSYPVPVTPGGAGSGVARFATHRLVHTGLRKLYQPSHGRFYLVVAEVFCDEPGLPRAGSHDDLRMTMVVRRRHTVTSGARAATRRLARNLLTELAIEHGVTLATGPPDADADDVLWADPEGRRRFLLDNADLVAELAPEVLEQVWTTVPGGGWRSAPPGPDGALPQPGEEELPMFRLPPRPGCPPDGTRSLWFGLVPTYSGEHGTDEHGHVETKLDDRGIYQIRCVVTQPPPPGHEHCPPHRWASEPTAPFRLAAAYDPDGTKNRIVSVTAPDLRRLAARAAQPQGPGGLRLRTPPGSGLGPVDFQRIPGANLGSPSTGAQVCTFAFELFFMIALFLFLLFLPIVVLAFQLWWMLALRFCLPPISAVAQLEAFFATNPTPGLPQLAADAARSADLDALLGMPRAAQHLAENGSDFVADPQLAADLVATLDPRGAVTTPAEPPLLHTPPDPLCPGP